MYTDMDYVPSFRRDTITSYTSKALAKTVKPKPYDERHADTVY